MCYWRQGEGFGEGVGVGEFVGGGPGVSEVIRVLKRFGCGIGCSGYSLLNTPSAVKLRFFYKW